MTFLVECQECRKSFVAEVPIGAYAPYLCLSCGGGGYYPREEVDPLEDERQRYRFQA